MLIKSGARKNRPQGFTLIELMVVIAIIGILAAVLTPVLMRARFKTYHTACVQNERNLATALELYSLEHDQLFPDDLITLVNPSSPYIKAIETCPCTGTSYTGTYTVDNNNTEYLLTCPGGHDLQLPGLVDPNYPQMANGILNQYNPTH